MGEATPAFVAAFREFFDGQRDAYAGDGGQRVIAPVDDDLVADHLAGRRRVGVYCLAGPDRDRCRWACVDVEGPDVELARLLVAKLKALGIAANLERSKGRGWHVWTFFSSWVQAWKVRAALGFAIRDLGDRVAFPLPMVPEQPRLPTPDAAGGYMWLPMFGGDRDGRTRFYDSATMKEVAGWRPGSLTANREAALDEVLEDLGIDGPPEERPYERGDDERPAAPRHDALLPCATRALKDGVQGEVAPEWAMRLSIHLRRNGYDVGGTLGVLASWNAQRVAPPLSDVALAEAVQSAHDSANADEGLGCDREAVLPLCARANCQVWRLKHGSAGATNGKRQDDNPNSVHLTTWNETAMEFHFARGPIVYHVLALDNRRGQNKCVLVVEKDGKPMFRGGANLDSEQSRRMIERRVFEQCKIGDVAVDMMNMAIGIEQEIQKKVRDQREREQRSRQGYTLTEKEIDEAKAWAREHPRVLYDVVEFTSRHGLVREMRNRCLLYLLGTSRKMLRPISGIGKGDSASGKSHLASTIFAMFPEEDLVEFTRVTASALFYRGEFSLQHKIFFVREAPGSEESEHSLRTFMTEGDLRLSTVQKNESTGRNETTDLRVRGPMAFYTTTTSVQVNPENETRLLQVQADESEAMTRAVFDPQAWAAKHGSLDPSPEQVALWRNFQRVLSSKEEVVVPFANRLRAGFPTATIRARRDFGRMLELVKACAYLHQFHRQKREIVGGDGQPRYEIVASVADYAIVKALVEGSIMRSTLDVKSGQESLVSKLAGLAEAAIEAHGRGEALAVGLEVQQDDDGRKFAWVASPLLRQALGKTQRAVLQLVRSLEEEGLVEVMANRRPVRVRLGAKLATGDFVLPTVAPEELFNLKPDDREHLYDPLSAPDFQDLHPMKE